MSKREMRCPHADKVSDCPECLAQLEAMSSTDPLREQIEPFVWYQPNTPEMDMGGNVTESDTLMVTIELDELMHLISQDRVERDIDSRIDELKWVISESEAGRRGVYLQTPKGKNGLGSTVHDRLAELNKLRKDGK